MNPLNYSLKGKIISVIGLGYVGLPLAVEFAKKYKVVGFDINLKRVNELKNSQDLTLEVSPFELKSVLQENNKETNFGLTITNCVSDLLQSDIYIVTVPTPTDKYNKPILSPMLIASEMIGNVLKPGNIVIYESTVYPGVTEDECVPILESYSKLKFNKDFFVGYSPERINPGDKEHTFSKILKITSGSTPETSEIVDNLYKSVVIAGTYKASSIKVAEAAKVIENTQRDINIAFINELSKIFNLLNIDTNEVLEAAATKWNFLKFKPGLVGGHCIGVDPFYLAQKAQEVGYHPEIILAGRRINDSMGSYVAQETVKLMIKKQLNVSKANVLILGITFKENCPDIRNTKVIDIYNELLTFDTHVDIFDPLANEVEVLDEYGIKLLSSVEILDLERYSAIIHAVSHDGFKDLKLMKNVNCVIFDVKSTLPVNSIDARL
jgi:UDP-N-acetyl-D-galactosamine dehydrogenase